MDATRRLLGVFIAGLMLSSILALVVHAQAPATADAPIPHSVVTAPPTTAPTSTTAVMQAPPTTAAAKKPVDAPVDDYAPEPIVRIGTIEIPKIGLTSPIYHGISLRNIDLGPSHWPGTAMPGQVGNTVFAGHRVTHTHPFLHIDQLAPGDQVIFTVDGVRSVYVVTGHEVVTPSETQIVNQTPTATGTLFACHPPHSAAYRYVVHLALSTPPPAQ